MFCSSQKKLYGEVINSLTLFHKTRAIIRFDQHFSPGSAVLTIIIILLRNSHNFFKLKFIIYISMTCINTTVQHPTDDTTVFASDSDINNVHATVNRELV